MRDKTVFLFFNVSVCLGFLRVYGFPAVQESRAFGCRGFRPFFGGRKNQAAYYGFKVFV
jgi:hypothetical protein